MKEWWDLNISRLGGIRINGVSTGQDFCAFTPQIGDFSTDFLVTDGFSGEGFDEVIWIWSSSGYNFITARSVNNFFQKTYYLLKQQICADTIAGITAEAVEGSGEKVLGGEAVQFQRVPKWIVVEDKVLEDLVPSQALDDADLMVEGVILSDSELMVEGEILSDSELKVEDGIDDEQEGEQGEITDIMEEEVLGGEDGGEEGGDEQTEVNDIPNEGSVEKAAKKKSAKTEEVWQGEQQRSGFVQGFISLRKKLMAKDLAKNGDKGTAPAKKASPLSLRTHRSNLSRKEYMMVYACYRFGLRFTLVKHRVGMK
ncbi:hypothetical protein HID58_086835 [Brassica napus]|uniref:Uncharacterized protein n=1 Tax=Brassica napus TaxID=3708 RepID=A0ABQ7XRH4_BRANA|nr:hypothetical protein HID58_086835 [Brassica napus]